MARFRPREFRERIDNDSHKKKKQKRKTRSFLTVDVRARQTCTSAIVPRATLATRRITKPFYDGGRIGLYRALRASFPAALGPRPRRFDIDCHAEESRNRSVARFTRAGNAAYRASRSRHVQLTTN